MTGHWLTVVTIVKDDPIGLDETLESLLAQGDALTGVEWLVIDSSEPHEHAASAAARAAHHLSSSTVWVPPRGIYPAMNEGLARAAGEYVSFLNAGDILLDRGLAAMRQATLEGTQWGYGQVRFRSRAGQLTTPPPFDYPAERRAHFARGRFPAHQGTFARAALLRELGGFDTTFRIAADYALMLRLSQVADPVESPEVIAEFREGGASTIGWFDAAREFHRARRQILRPRGTGALRETLATVGHAARVAAYRVVVEPARGR